MKGLMIKAALLTALFSSHAMAWDCTNPANWSLNVPGNECYHVGPNPNAPATTPGNTNTSTNTNTLGQGQSQTQGQGQSQQATGGNATGGKSTSTSTSNATGGKGGKATSNAAGGAGGMGGAGGAGGTGTATSASDSHAVTTLTAPSSATVDSHDTSSTYIAAPRIPVNTAIAGYQDTNAPCRFAEGVGIQTMPAGGSVGFTFKDHDCWRWRMAEYFYAHNQTVAGDRMVCTIGDVKKAFGKDCLDVVGVVFNPPLVAPLPVDAVSHKELQEFETRQAERDRRIITHTLSK